MPFSAAEVLASIMCTFWQAALFIAFAFCANEAWCAAANMTIVLRGHKAVAVTRARLLIARIVLAVISSVAGVASASVATVAVYAVPLV